MSSKYKYQKISMMIVSGCTISVSVNFSVDHLSFFFLYIGLALTTFVPTGSATQLKQKKICMICKILDTKSCRDRHLCRQVLSKKNHGSHRSEALSRRDNQNHLHTIQRTRAQHTEHRHSTDTAHRFSTQVG